MSAKFHQVVNIQIFDAQAAQFGNKLGRDP